MPQVRPDTDLDDERFERRFAALEARQSSLAQHAAKEPANIDLVIAAVDRTTAKLDQLTNGLAENVLMSIQTLKHVV